MIAQRLETYLRRRCTLLGVGPMSVNCVDATIELANEFEVPLLLVASRRQIDSGEFGGGYVNHWTTEEFARYVIDRDKKGKILLARDHGGPWQNDREKEDGLSLRRAMASAKSSFSVDIESGFQVLHIDPSVDIHGIPSVDEVLDRLFELYEFCWAKAQRLGQEVIFEIGTEQQSGSTNTQDALGYILSSMRRFCDRYHLPFPTFVVVQAGTKVMESRNIGSFDAPVRVAEELPPEIQVPKMIQICDRYKIFMKVHNSDYLSDEALQWYPRLGIHSANVAPEFGVAETCALIEVLETKGMGDLAERFLQMSYESRKWRKWMLPDSRATDRECAIIAGHYLFSSDECRELRAEAQTRLNGLGLNLDTFLKDRVKRSVFRFLQNFGPVRLAN